MPPNRCFQFHVSVFFADNHCEVEGVQFVQSVGAGVVESKYDEVSLGTHVIAAMS